MSAQEDEIKSLEILVNATRNKVDYQLNADNGLDAKAGVMIALEVGIVTFYIQSVHHLCGFLFIPIVIFGFSIYLLWGVLNVKTYNTGVVDFYNDQKNYRSMKSDTLLEGSVAILYCCLVYQFANCHVSIISKNGDL